MEEYIPEDGYDMHMLFTDVQALLSKNIFQLHEECKHFGSKMGLGKVFTLDGRRKH